MHDDPVEENEYERDRANNIRKLSAALESIEVLATVQDLKRMQHEANEKDGREIAAKRQRAFPQSAPGQERRSERVKSKQGQVSTLPQEEEEEGGEPLLQQQGAVPGPLDQDYIPGLDEIDDADADEEDTEGSGEAVRPVQEGLGGIPDNGRVIAESDTLSKGIQQLTSILSRHPMSFRRDDAAR